MIFNRTLLRSTILTGVTMLAVGGVSSAAQAQFLTSNNSGSEQCNSATTCTLQNLDFAGRINGTNLPGTNPEIVVDTDTAITVSGGIDPSTNTYIRYDSNVSLATTAGGASFEVGNLRNVQTTGANSTIIVNGVNLQDGILINAGGTISNTGAGETVLEFTAGSDISAGAIDVDGTLSATPTGLAVDTSAADAGIAIELDIDATVQGGFALGQGDTITVDGSGATSTLTLGQNLTGDSAGGTETFVMNADADDTVQINGDLIDFDALTVTQGIVDIDGAVTNLAAASVASNGTLNITNVGGDAFATTSGLDINGGTLVTDNGTAITGAVTIAGDSTVTGDLVMADGQAASLTFDGTGSSTFAGGFSGGADADDTLTVNRTGGGPDVVTIQGAVAGFETVTLTDGSLTLSGAVSDVTTFNVGAADVLTFDTNASGVTFTDINLQGADSTVTFNRSGQNFAGDITGAAGTQILNANNGNVGQAGATIDMAAGDDTIALNGGAITADTLDGGDNNDEITVGTSGGSISSAISNIETLTISGGGTATLTGSLTDSTNVTLTNTGDQLTINNDGGSFAFGTITDTANGSNTSVVITDGTVTAGTVNLNDGNDTFTLTAGSFNATSVALGDGTNTLNITAGTFGTTPSGFTVTGGADADDINIAAGTVNADLTLGNGANTLDVTGAAAIAGNITGGDDADTLTFGATTGAVSGDINTGAGNDVIVLNGGTFTGTITPGAGNDTITYDAGTFDTAINMGANGTDTFNVTSDLSNGATLDGVDILSVGAGNTFTVANAINATTNGAGDLDLATGSTIIADAANVRVGGNIDFVGASTARVNNGRTITAANVGNAANGTFITEFGNTSAGKFVLTDANVDLSDATLQAIPVSGTNFNGNVSHVVVDAAAGDITGFGTITDNNSLFAFSQTEDDVNGDIILNIARENSLAVVASTPNTTKTAVPLETVLTDNSITSAYPAVTQLATRLTTASDEEIDEIIESLTPTVDTGAVNAGINVTTETNSIINSRLEVASKSSGETGMTAGNSMKGLRFWLQGLGSHAEQDRRDQIDGYDSDTYGITAGVDTRNIHDDAILGLALSYANTDIDSDNANRTNTDVDSYQITAYGNFQTPYQTYLNTYLSYAYNDIAYTRSDVGIIGNTASADYDSDQYGARMELGRDYFAQGSYEGFIITPELSAEYILVDTEEYSENDTSGLGLQNVDTETLETLTFGVDVTAAYTYAQEDGSRLIPSASIGYSYEALGEELETSASFFAGGATFNSTGVDPAQHSVNGGLGVVYETTQNWSLSADYDYTYKSDYDRHSGMVKATYSF